MAGHASTGTLTWGKACWRAGMTLEKSKGSYLCLRGIIHEKEKPVSAGTCSGQAALSPGQDSCAGEGLTWRGQSVCDGDLLDPGPRVLQFH